MADLALDPIRPGTAPALADAEAAPPDGLPRGKSALADAIDEAADALGDRQQALYADGRHAVLVVLQGRDASGKDGAIRRVFRGCSPLGLHVAGFSAPTARELAHDFLWRVHREVPARRYLGVFNRSHYEDVLVARVRGLVPEAAWRARFAQIVAFEELLAAAGVRVLKFMLHVSRAEQRKRLLERLDDPAKRWKFDPADLDDRDAWDAYTDAYRDAIARCGTAAAPWFVVPADDKKVRDLLIARTLVRELDALGLRVPEAAFDVEAARARLAGGAPGD
ncbi:PPK2 family polyphosphate kinase [Roseisolibacter sp. H3M3-2]|uniref:PPK2 family polyphosphate kinase n=1 Tax=Roseisolibacter sp. H3M3-2 TaxID=3031323 RepID=UPI0023DA56A5|nr:PPK2 family polyphosphate kinase [Roseisolibacter sp. H3M3-2]MDF1501562.1 polyphosphate kinase 2 family protein [Roseisolibacter sp. H3M3-2]